MDPRRRALSLSGLSGLSVGFSLPAFGQDAQERTIRFGHLNNDDDPVSAASSDSASSSPPRAAAR